MYGNRGKPTTSISDLSDDGTRYSIAAHNDTSCSIHKADTLTEEWSTQSYNSFWQQMYLFLQRKGSKNERNGKVNRNTILLLNVLCFLTHSLVTKFSSNRQKSTEHQFV